MTSKDVDSLKHIMLEGNHILILDGGVSTHLEDQFVRHFVDEVQHQSHNEDKNSCVVGVFPYRELWSSSLLLTNEGKELIRRGHMNWRNAGVDILTTVTYQCHYESKLWPKRQPGTSRQYTEEVAEGEAENHLLLQQEAREHETGGGDCQGSEIITESIMDGMWKSGMELAEGVARMTEEENPMTAKGQSPRHCYIAASSGCYGAALANGAEYTGEYGVGIAEIRSFHQRKLRTILPLHPHAIAVETIPSLTECRALVELLNDTQLERHFATNPIESDCNNSVSPPLPAFWISLACQNEYQLNDGTDVKDAIQLLLTSIPPSRLQGIGFNCCNVLHLHSLVTILIQQIIESKQHHHNYNDTYNNSGSSCAIVIYPNSGEIYDAVNATWTVGTGCLSPESMARNIMEVVHTIENVWKTLNSRDDEHTIVAGLAVASARIKKPTIIVGGCCRTSPETISELRKLVDEHLKL